MLKSKYIIDEEPVLREFVQRTVANERLGRRLHCPYDLPGGVLGV